MGWFEFKTDLKCETGVFWINNQHIFQKPRAEQVCKRIAIGLTFYSVTKLIYQQKFKLTHFIFRPNLPHNLISSALPLIIKKGTIQLLYSLLFFTTKIFIHTGFQEAREWPLQLRNLRESRRDRCQPGCCCPGRTWVWRVLFIITTILGGISKDNPTGNVQIVANGVVVEEEPGFENY